MSAPRTTPSSTPPRWKRPATRLLLAAAIAAASPLAALDPAGLALGDPHLAALPRTPDERARIKAATAPAADFTAPERFEDRPAGAATVRARRDGEALSQHSANLSFEQELDFTLGDGLFKKLWVFSPASTLASDGLGPLYNARSCQRCHVRDGRGHVPAGPGGRPAEMFLRISVPGPVPAQMQAVKDYTGTAPDPVYGGQLQDLSAPGIKPEYRLRITYDEIDVPLNGGETATLRKPRYEAADLGYGPLHPQAMLSPRLAPPMTGLGLLEAVPAAAILAHADEDDADGDGISGRPNLVWSEKFGQVMLGRFGLKAGKATVHEQSAAAFAGDLGISTPMFPAGYGDCTAPQAACRNAPHGGGDARGTEIGQSGMDLVTFYARNLGVPARRDPGDPEVLRGKEVFYTVGCPACHVPKFVTHRLADRPEHSFQLIWPYSDLLLHDMGEDLADHRPEARATGREWRTAPLWGIGLAKQVSARATYLHDGRARTLLEAVLWHGGEAKAARGRVVEMTPEDRAALISFLKSL